MKRRNPVMVVVMIGLMLVMAACGGRQRTASESSAVPEMYDADGSALVAPAPAAPMEAAAAEEMAVSDTANAQAPPGQERLIIRTADMTIVVTDTEEALARVTTMAESSGGWVVSSNVYQSSDTAKSGYIQIRVPAEGFQSVLDAISGLAVEVTNLSTSGQDVTEEYVDLTSQLGNLEATAQRLRTFLDEARNTEEALAVNMELSRIEGEIEVIKGRMQYLERSSAFSSITVNLTPDELAQPIQVAGWQPKGVAKEALEALVNALQTLADLIIWFVIFVLPVLLLILVPFALLVWVIRRLRRRERAAPEATNPPAAD